MLGVLNIFINMVLLFLAWKCADANTSVCLSKCVSSHFDYNAHSGRNMCSGGVCAVMLISGFKISGKQAYFYLFALERNQFLLSRY